MVECKRPPCPLLLAGTPPVTPGPGFSTPPGRRAFHLALYFFIFFIICSKRLVFEDYFIIMISVMIT